MNCEYCGSYEYYGKLLQGPGFLVRVSFIFFPPLSSIFSYIFSFVQSPYTLGSEVRFFLYSTRLSILPALAVSASFTKWYLLCQMSWNTCRLNIWFDPHYRKQTLLRNEKLLNEFNELLILDLDNSKYFRTNGIISLESGFTFTALHLRRVTFWNWRCLRWHWKGEISTP